MKKPALIMATMTVVALGGGAAAPVATCGGGETRTRGDNRSRAGHRHSHRKRL